MEENVGEMIEEAKEELKRVDHLIYVSLKYTRTADVIKNALLRLLSTFDFIMEAVLIDAENHKKIESIPKSPKLKMNLLLELYPDDKKLGKYLHFYNFLREVINSPYGKREEFRRHVTMIISFPCSTAEICIDNLENCEDLTKDFLKHVVFLIAGIEEE